jgi:hypothetical protein
MDLAKALDTVSVQQKELDFPTLCREFEDVENRFISQLDEQTEVDERRCVQRAVASAIFHSAIGKRSPISVCESCLRDLATIGFQDFHHECICTLALCRYFVEQGTIEQVYSYLDRLEANQNVQEARLEWLSAAIFEIKNSMNKGDRSEWH